MSERERKAARLSELLARHRLNAVALRRTANVAWLTGGARTYVDTSAELGVATLVVTPRGRYLVTDTIEAARLEAEEPLDGWAPVVRPWYAPEDGLAELTAGLALGADFPCRGAKDLSAELVHLRAPLEPEEVERYRALGRDLGAAMRPVADAIRAGMTEHAVAGRVARAVYDIGAVPVVVLAAADERLTAFRHPLPTDTPVRDALLWVVCARRSGLIANLSRMMCFGPPSDDLRRRVRAVAEIEATAVAHTRPGAAVSDIFEQIRAAYGRVGFAEAWREHHQGGACSYAPRDFVATAESTARVQAPQAFAWNPSVPGAKSEDTVLCTEAGCEVLTRTPGWPALELDVGGRTVRGNDLLEK